VELHVDVRINPHPKKMRPDELDKLLNGALVGFETWVMKQQASKGFQPLPLISAERAVVKGFMIYMATEHGPDAG
jgi:hypothetical protein